MPLLHERLTDESEHRATGMQVGAMLLLVLGAVLAVNAWAIQQSPTDSRTYEGVIIGRKWDLASGGAPAGGIVVVGDSGGNFGVVGSVLTEVLGSPVVNVCTFGRFVMMGARWMLDHAVSEAEAPPALALVMIGTQTLVKEPDGFVFAQVPVPFSAARSNAAAFSPKELAEFAVARAFPLFTESTSFRDSLRSGLVPDRSRIPMDADGSSWMKSNEYSEKMSVNVETKAIPEIEAHAGPIPTVRDRKNIERMIQDADSRGYDLVFVDGPIWKGMVALPEQVELYRQFHEYIDAICATSERAWHLPGPIQTFEAGEMENPFHLMRPAALRYTAELANRLGSLGLPRAD